MPQQAESKNLSIVLTDLRGYSERSEKSSRAEIANLIKTHNDLLRPVIEFYRGRVVKTLGDSFLCAFESATDASVCSIAIQIIVQEFNRRQREQVKKLNIRIMIASGDVTIEGGDIYGEAVNIVSRMEKMPEFKGGGIGLSESTYLLMNQQEIQAEPIGEQTFREGGRAIKLYRVPLDRQKLTQLPTKLLDLVQQVAEGKVISLGSSAPRWTPARWQVAAAVGAVLLMVPALWLFKRGTTRAPAGTSTNIWDMLRRSDPNGDGTIFKEDFIGPPEMFSSLDADGDGVVGPPEVQKWAKAHGNLPPRPMKGMFPGKVPPPDHVFSDEAPQEDP